jgi:hypothetical protein
MLTRFAHIPAAFSTLFSLLVDPAQSSLRLEWRCLWDGALMRLEGLEKRVNMEQRSAEGQKHHAFVRFVPASARYIPGCAILSLCPAHESWMGEWAA